MNIAHLLGQNQREVSNLLRRYRVAGAADMQTIKIAHDRHGERFMMELLEILVPDQDNFSTLITPSTSAFIATGAKQISDSQAAQLEAIQQEAETKGKFWGFWDNILNAIGKTGVTIGEFKENSAGSVNSQEYLSYQFAQRAQTRTILTIAGLVFLVILLILLFRKK